MQFSLLWSLFEARVLNTNASAATIEAAVSAWEGAGQLSLETFAEDLAYFRQRYFPNGQVSYHFAHLNFRPNDKQDLVRAVLSGENPDAAAVVTALLTIVYRLRNNLFHGIKWAYDIEGQLLNFTHANNALMAALETNGME